MKLFNARSRGANSLRADRIYPEGYDQSPSKCSILHTSCEFVTEGKLILFALPAMRTL